MIQEIIPVPETTARLLEAIRSCGNVSKVVIGAGKITYLPIKTRETTEAIEKAGLSDVVQRFVLCGLRKQVESQFRIGSYDVSGHKIVVKS